MGKDLHESPEKYTVHRRFLNQISFNFEHYQHIFISNYLSHEIIVTRNYQRIHSFLCVCMYPQKSNYTFYDDDGSKYITHEN